jgi:O-antigen/teichoic acid export membrane protein
MLVGHSMALALTFARNIVLARLLGPEQFGIAVTYAIVMAFLEASLEFGPDKYILQAPDGDSREILGAAHAFTLGRGIAAGLVLFLAAEPVAALFHVPELAWAYRMAALAPIIKGFVHFGFRQAQRRLVFRQEIIIVLASNAVGFLAAVGFASIHPSHLAMLIGMVAQVAAAVGVSFLLAAVPYRLCFGRLELAALFRFGWPLVVNSILIVAAMQGDRALIGSAFGPETLAVYATAAILAGAPLHLVAGVLGPIMVPVLGPLRGQPLFRTRYEAFGAVIAIVAVAALVPIGLLGPPVIPIVFGAAYRPDPLLVAVLAASAGIGLMRAWTNIAALAVGNSKAALLTNGVRLSGLVLAGLAVVLGGDVILVALALFGGEVAALAFAMQRTHQINNLPATTGLGFLAPAFVAMIVMVISVRRMEPLDWQAGLMVTAALVLLSIGFLLALSSSGRDVVRGLASALRPQPR